MNLMIILMLQYRNPVTIGVEVGACWEQCWGLVCCGEGETWSPRRIDTEIYLNVKNARAAHMPSIGQALNYILASHGRYHWDTGHVSSILMKFKKNMKV